MDSKQFRVYGKEMVDYVCDYLDNIQSRRVVSDVVPGYLAEIIPKEAPQKGEDWHEIMKDIETKIMPGVTHWQHPQFHAYFPNGNSFPSILADILSDAIGCVGFSWAASPACTELELVVLDWFAKALNLPSFFLFSSPESKGGGVLQSSASECILICMLAARTQALKYLKKKNGVEHGTGNEFLPQLVAYCSKEAHSCVEKNAIISLVQLRTLDVDKSGSLRGPQVQEAIEKDIEAGLHPFFILATIGSTGACSFDNLMEIGPIAKKYPACWFHVDGAYAGSSLICPENRYFAEGLHYTDSFNTNCNKWLTVCYDCSCLWVKDRMKIISALTVDPLYLQHENAKSVVDYRHWGIPLSRRFRSLKLWFTLRNYGIEGLQKYIRNHMKLAKYFEELVLRDDRFEICNEVKLGLVCFRLKGSDKLNQQLLATINSAGDVHMIPSMFQGRYVIRFCVTYQHATPQIIDKSWALIQAHATEVLDSHAMKNGDDAKAPKKLNRRHSFTRKVSRELYEKRSSRHSLHDGATPIIIPENNNLGSSSDSDDVFSDAE